MSVEEIIRTVKEQYGKDISEAEARAVLKKANEAVAGGELPDDALEGVSGGMGRVLSLIQDIFGNLGKLV